MCLDGGAFLFLQDSTQWRLSLQTEQIQVLRHRHLTDRHDAAPVIVAHIQIPFEMYDDCRRALHRDWATAFLVKFVEIATNASIEGSDVQVFDDVPIGHTMFEDINKAYAIGITKGTGDGSKFEPYRDVTREKYATMLYRTFDYIEQSIGQKLILRSLKMVSFADKDDISSWAIEALGILSNADLFRGTAEGMLDPKGVISIEQAIVLSYRGILLVQNRDEQNKS